MKIGRLTTVLVAVVLVSIAASVWAAPVESVESARASAARLKLDAFLSEKQVVAQLANLGITPEQAQARLAQLSDTQLAQVAAQVDLLKSGGTIEPGHPNPFGPVGCVFKCVGDTIVHIVKFLFCWTDV